MKEQILNAAMRLFSRRGFDGTSLQDIAEAVGIRKASLFHHFPSKEEMRLRVLDKLLSHWNEVLPRILAATSAGVDQSDAIIQEGTAFFMADPDRARFLAREILDSAQGIEALLNTHVRPWFAILCQHIRKGQAAGRIYSDVDPEAYILQMVNLVVCSIATYDMLGPLIEESAGDQRFIERHNRELLRVSRASLFQPPGYEINEDRPHMENEPSPLKGGGFGRGGR